MDRITTGTCTIDETEIKYVTDALQSGMLSSGKYLHAFESTMAQFYNKNYAILVNSGQTALELAILSYRNKIGGGELLVGVPVLTYMATIWSLLIDSGVRPVFFDIDKKTYCMDCNSSGVDEVGQSYDIYDLDLIVPVDLFGKKCNLPVGFGNCPIIEDACEAVANPGCKYGDYVALSFYSSHILSCGSGGMILLDDDDEAAYIRSYIAHGRNHDGDFTTRTNDFMDRFIFSSYGQSLRSDNITAAIGLAQFEKKDKIINARSIVSRKITSGLKRLEDKKILTLPCFKENVFMFYPVVFHTNLFDVLDFMKYLWDNNIDSRRFMPVLGQPAFTTMFPNIKKTWFPNAAYCGDRGVLFGCHQDMTDDQIEYLVQKIEDYFYDLE